MKKRTTKKERALPKARVEKMIVRMHKIIDKLAAEIRRR